MPEGYVSGLGLKEVEPGKYEVLYTGGGKRIEGSFEADIVKFKSGKAPLPGTILDIEDVADVWELKTGKHGIPAAQRRTYSIIFGKVDLVKPLKYIKGLSIIASYLGAYAVLDRVAAGAETGRGLPQLYEGVSTGNKAMIRKGINFFKDRVFDLASAGNAGASGVVITGREVLQLLENKLCEEIDKK